MPEQLPSPYFVFERLPNIERESGHCLAGTLVINYPQGIEINNAIEKEIDVIKDYLLSRARSGLIPKGFLLAWRGVVPPNASDMVSRQVLEEWAEKRLVIDVRVGSYDRNHDCLAEKIPLNLIPGTVSKIKRNRRKLLDSVSEPLEDRLVLTDSLLARPNGVSARQKAGLANFIQKGMLFNCYRCGGQFICETTAEEARAEYDARGGKDDDDCPPICDPCYKSLLHWKKSRGKDVV